jgi:hypothetical protein
MCMDEAVTKALDYLRGLGYHATRDSLVALWKPYLARRSSAVQWQTLARRWVESR